MKTPKAKKLKSGNWRIQIQIDNERYSITRSRKEDAEQEAKEFFAGKKREKTLPITVGEAIDKYIASKENVLSPSTIRSYKVVRKSYLKSIMDLKLSYLTQTDVQLAVGEDAANGRSPKTIRNAHGLLSAMLKEYRPEFTLNTRMPQKKKNEVILPSEKDMQKIWKEVEGTQYELPILLASWLGLRQSEIRGLKFSDIQNGKIHIHRALVRGEKEYVEKAPKTTSGDRWIVLPEPIAKLIAELPRKSDDEYLVKLSANALRDSFHHVCDRVGVQRCRFHDLRHFAASEALALGVPDKYSMRRMGHATDNMLKNVYQHVIAEKEESFSSLIDKRMSELYYNK